jgi:tRNA(Ile)-lysidine synthase
MAISHSRFFRHVQSFWRAHTGGKPRAVVVGVSGGVDSRLLLEFAVWSLEQGDVTEVRAVSVHHHTRLGQSEELAIAEAAALRLELSYTTLHRTGEIPTANAEEELRKARIGLLTAALQPNEELWLGHHLDDSWEWAQLQQARSSEVISGLGIPLKNDRILRPFLCVSREQIVREATQRKLAWLEDPTNLGPDYARAHFRQKVQPGLKAAHPQYLKHYARRSQRLAEELGVALKKKSLTHRHQTSEAILLSGVLTESALLDAVKTLSVTTRGTLNQEVPKVLRAHAAGKKGPFDFSGGVRAVGYGEWLLVMRENFQARDVLPSENAATPWTRAQFKTLIEESLERGLLEHAPFWVSFDPDQKHRNVLVASGRDPLWPSLTGQRAVPVIHAQKLLQRWTDPQQVLWLQPLWPTSH